MTIHVRPPAPVRWGLVGTTGFASFACVPGFAASASGTLTAVAGSDLDRTRAFAGEHGLATATDDVAALASADVDAVWITSPPHLHAEHARTVLEAGKHALVEKPLTIDPGAARDLVALAAAGGLVLATGYQARAVPAHQVMRDLIASGALGEVYAARTWYATPVPAKPPTWRRDRRTAGWGVLGDTATHHIDLVRMLVGEVVEARAMSTSRVGFETEDVAAAVLRLDGGALASITAARYLAVAGTRVEVHGTAGSLVAVDTSPRGEGSVTLQLAGAAPEALEVARPLSWAALVDAVGEAIAGRPSSYATGEDGARGVEILTDLVGRASTG